MLCVCVSVCVCVCVTFYLGRLKQEVEVKQHSLKLLRQRVSGSESAQMAEAVAATQAELQQAKAAVEAAKQKKADMIKTAKVIRPGPTDKSLQIYTIARTCS